MHFIYNSPFTIYNFISPCIISKFYRRLTTHILSNYGKPIPENDIWIAALALQHELTLATRDKHFKVVDGLETALW